MNADLINDFDTGWLASFSSVAIRCTTQEEADLFLDYQHARGEIGAGTADRLKSYWYENLDSTCYRLYGAGYCDAQWYLERGVTVVDFQDIYHPQTNKPLNIEYGYDELFS